jgi:hypothetical protein
MVDVGGLFVYSLRFSDEYRHIVVASTYLISGPASRSEQSIT